MSQRRAKSKRLSLFLTVAGLVLSLLVGILVYTDVSDARSIRASVPTTQVVVAAVDIPSRTEIAASMLTVQAIPDQLMQTGAATKVEDVAGRFTPDGFFKGEVINMRASLGPRGAARRIHKRGAGYRRMGEVAEVRLPVVDGRQQS